MRHGDLSILAAASLGAGTSGFLAALLATSWSPSLAHLQGYGHLAPYTYGSPDCSGSPVDPISIVFSGWNFNSSTIRAHAEMGSHGWFNVHGGSPQYFMDHGSCQPFDDQSADGGMASDRHHMRYNLGDAGGVPEQVAPYGYLAPATPHKEEWISFLEDWDCRGTYGGNHAVWANDEVPGGGFVAARDYVLGLWLAAGDGHYVRAVQNWGNTAVREQCDGGLAWSDGFVYILAMSTPDVIANGNIPGRAFI